MSYDIYRKTTVRLNEEELKKFPVVDHIMMDRAVETLQLCYMEVPGHPAYALHHAEVNLNGGYWSGYLIKHNGVGYLIAGDYVTSSGATQVNWASLGLSSDLTQNCNSLMGQLYPLDDENVQLWVRDLHEYLKGLYDVPFKQDPLVGRPGYTRKESNSTHITVFPMPQGDWTKLNLYVLRPTESPFDTAASLLLNLSIAQRTRFHVAKKAIQEAEGLGQEIARQNFNRTVDELLLVARQRIEAKRVDIEEQLARVCTVDSHRAVKKIRRWYPNYEPQGNIQL